MTSSFRIEDGKLIGEDGAWSLDSISCIYKIEGGKLSMKKWLIVVAGLAALGAAPTMGAAGGIALTGGLLGYYLHKTKKVVILVNGTEIEILSVIFFEGIWNEENANAECDALVALVSPHIGN